MIKRKSDTCRKQMPLANWVIDQKKSSYYISEQSLEKNLSEVIVHYFAAIYLLPYDKSVTRLRIVFEWQKCAKLRILALFRCSYHPIFCLKIYFISILPAVSLPKIQEIMIKKLYRHIAKRYKYWRYRRLLGKLFWLYAQKTDNAYLAIHEASQAFIWFTNEEDDSNGIVWYYSYLESEASRACSL